jgi:Ca2+-binding EF-hand superfamily protein
MKRVLLPALALGMLAVAARAADDEIDILKVTNAEYLKALDKDGDGFIQLEELPEKFAAAFPKLDGDKNKKLDEKELGRLLFVLKQTEGKAATAVKSAMAALDKNKDGMLSPDEAKGNPLFNQNFKNWDVDGDGMLSKAELISAAKGEAPMAVASADPPKTPDGPKPGPGPGPRPQPQPPMAKPPIPKDLPFFDSLDKDFDGTVTQGELQGNPLFFYFGLIDADKNGKIDAKEYEAFVKKQAGE